MAGAKKMPAPKKVPGIDYLAQPGQDPNVSLGVIQALGPQGDANSMEAAVFRRLHPRDRPLDHTAPWIKPTCEHFEVMLTAGADDEFWKPQALCRAYDRAAFPSLRDVLVSITLRAPDLHAGRMRIHEYHRIVTGYARAHMVEARGLPVIAIVHVPAKSALAAPVHGHLLVPPRRLTWLGPADFCTELLEGGRPLVETEWAAWKKAHGL